MLLTINGTEYKIKYGYRVLAKTNVINEVIAMSEKEVDARPEEMFDLITKLLPKMLLLGLYKYNEEYRYDLDNESEYNNQLERMYDLIDEYIDDNDGNIVDLFSMLTDELVNNGFLSQKSQMVMEHIKETPNKKTKAKA